MKNGSKNEKLTYRPEIERFENEGGSIPELANRRTQKKDATTSQPTPNSDEKTEDKRTEIEKNQDDN